MSTLNQVYDNLARRQEHLLTDVTIFPCLMTIIKLTHETLKLEHSSRRYPHEVESVSDLMGSIKNVRDIEKHFQECRACRTLARTVVEVLQNTIPAQKD